MLTYSRVVFATIDAAKLIKKIFRVIIFPVAEFRYNVSDCGIPDSRRKKKTGSKK